MRRKPSASHCVKKPPWLVYRPDSSVFFSGAQVLRISSVKLSAAGGLSITSSSPSWRKDTLAPSACTRSSVSPTPCRRSACAGCCALRSMRSLLATMVLAGSRSNTSSTLRMKNADGAYASRRTRVVLGSRMGRGLRWGSTR